MRKSFSYRTSALRFRRWSRKAYATFVSVQHAVTIGQLSSSVADRLHKKSLSLHNGISRVFNGLYEDDFEETGPSSAENDSRLSLSLGLIMSLLTVFVSTEIAHPASYTYII